MSTLFFLPLLGSFVLVSYLSLSVNGLWYFIEKFVLGTKECLRIFIVGAGINHIHLVVCYNY